MSAHGWLNPASSGLQRLITQHRQLGIGMGDEDAERYRLIHSPNPGGSGAVYETWHAVIVGWYHLWCDWLVKILIGGMPTDPVHFL